MTRGSTKGMLPLTVIGGQVRTWISPVDARLLADRKRLYAGWARTDWAVALDDIVAEYEIWHQPIPFSGDTRAFIEHQVKSAPKRTT